jgi:hypothetical protein
VERGRQTMTLFGSNNGSIIKLRQNSDPGRFICAG